MQHELLSTTARALALLQHPSRFTCPHTLLHRRCAFRAHRQDLQLPPVFRAQVGSEATDKLLLVDNAIYVRKIRPAGADCFAALDLLPVAPYESETAEWRPLLAFRARARVEGQLSRPVRVMDWSCARG